LPWFKFFIFVVLSVVVIQVAALPVVRTCGSIDIGLVVIVIADYSP
jgi:hypothetical protein